MKKILPWILFLGTVIPRGECRVPIIQKLDVQCDRDGMTVRVEFDIPYNGIIFSKGHYNTPGCHYVRAGDSKTSLAFIIPPNTCGTQTSDSDLENTIVFQNDPAFQEVWDSARRLTCKSTVGKTSKVVTFQPFVVGMLDETEVHVPVQPSVECWMQLHRGKTPFAPPLSGVIKIGEVLTLAIYIRDQDHSHDILVKECYAYDNQDFDDQRTNKIQLTDENGCTLKEKLLTSFYQTRQTGNSGATVIAFAPINAFRFPESSNIYLACNVEICKGRCSSTCQLERLPDETIEEVRTVTPAVETTRAPQTEIITFRTITTASGPTAQRQTSTRRQVYQNPIPTTATVRKEYAVPHAANAFHSFHRDYGRFRTRIGRGKRDLNGTQRVKKILVSKSFAVAVA